MQICVFWAECHKIPEGRWVSFNMPHRHSFDIENAFLDIPRLLDLEGGICTTYVYVWPFVKLTLVDNDKKSNNNGLN